jgi:hypothetical protein
MRGPAPLRSVEQGISRTKEEKRMLSDVVGRKVAGASVAFAVMTAAAIGPPAGANGATAEQLLPTS